MYILFKYFSIYTINYNLVNGNTLCLTYVGPESFLGVQRTRADAKMEALEVRKRECDELFIQGDVDGAKAAYTTLLGDLTSVGGCSGEVVLLKKNVLNNLSAACLKLDDFLACVSFCDDAIALGGEELNLKALYRRAQAYKALGNSHEEEALFKLALADCDCILGVETQNPQAKGLRMEIKKAADELLTAKRYAYAKPSIAAVTSSSKVKTDCSKSEEDTECNKNRADSAYSFMNPTWQPSDTLEPTSNESSDGARLLVPQIRSIFAPAANGAASMKQLLREAKRISASAVPALGESDGAIESKAVLDALADLQRTEAETAASVGRRSAKAGGSDPLLNNEAKQRTGKYSARSSISAAKAGLEPQALSAWEQLQRDEAEAETKFKELLFNTSRRS